MIIVFLKNIALDILYTPIRKIKEWCLLGCYAVWLL
jgi:hypothetical protein